MESTIHTRILHCIYKEGSVVRMNFDVPISKTAKGLLSLDIHIDGEPSDLRVYYRCFKEEYQSLAFTFHNSVYESMIVGIWGYLRVFSDSCLLEAATVDVKKCNYILLNKEEENEKAF